MLTVSEALNLQGLPPDPRDKAMETDRPTVPPHQDQCDQEPNTRVIFEPYFCSSSLPLPLPIHIRTVY